MLGLLLFGPASRDNPANLMVWLVWWPALCLMFAFAGRMWCGLFCPFALLGTLAQRFLGLRLPVPEFFKQHGGWMMLLAYFLLFWMEEISHVADSPRKTAIVLLTMLSGALMFGLLFRGLAWCRHLCPLGAISHVYSYASLFKIRSNEAACGDCLTKDCVVPDERYAGCPMQMTPFAMDSVAHCRFCGSCVKRCTNNSVQVRFEAPSKDLAGAAASTPALVWFIVLLAGWISYLNCVKSAALPIAGWLQTAAAPVLVKTVVMAAALGGGVLLFIALVRLAGRGPGGLSRQQLELLAGVPMIPMLLFSHFGYLGAGLLSDGGMLLARLADVVGAPWLKIDGLWGSAWTRYFGALCTAAGFAVTLAVSKWALSRTPGAPPSAKLYFWPGYALFAAFNLVAAWPLGAALPAGPDAAPGPESWSILWPFFGVNAAILILVLIARRQQPDPAEESRDFSATRTWALREGAGPKQAEIFNWLVEQAIQAQWRIPAMVSLGNAAQEIITFLQRTLPEGTSITVNAILRKNKAVMTIAHAGQPLNLPDYKAPPSLDDADEAMEGIELRLAVAQVEHMSYQARLSEGRCTFTLRQPC